MGRPDLGLYGPARAPELPARDGLVPAAKRHMSPRNGRDRNWVQSVEGALDTSHFVPARRAFQGRRYGTRRLAGRPRSPTSPSRRSHPLDTFTIPRPKFTCRHDAGLPDRGAARRTGLISLAYLANPDAQPAYTPTASPARLQPGPCVAGRRRDVLDLHLMLAARLPFSNAEAPGSMAVSTSMPRSTPLCRCATSATTT
jgi:hypothetical protein